MPRFPRLHSRWKNPGRAEPVVFIHFPQCVEAVLGRLPQPLCRVVVSNGHKKAPFRGLEHLDRSRFLEAHDTCHGAQIGIEVGVEGRVVVADGAVGILEAVSGQNADHR